jgi:hypothetical protein
MRKSKVDVTQNVERLEDPNDKGKVFYRVMLSPKPSREAVEALYDLWNNPGFNPNCEKQELLCDYAGNLLIHADSSEDEGPILDLLQDALANLNRAETITG